jgi:signal peptidase II
VKGVKVVLLISLIVIADQALKIYIKTHYHLYEEHAIFGNWFRLLFVENEGMAYGMQLGGNFGKMLLTFFRLGAVIFGVYYLRKVIKRHYKTGFIVCAAMIFAGALGNLIDSMFYGLIFDESSEVYPNVARIFPGHGYAGFFRGKVVDMLHFPVINTHIPSWVPVWGGDQFRFFQPIFNIADASISLGVIALILFQKRFLPAAQPQAVTSTTNVTADEEVTQ